MELYISFDDILYLNTILYYYIIENDAVLLTIAINMFMPFELIIC